MIEQVADSFPLSDNTRKEVDKLSKSKDFRILVFRQILIELSKDPKNDKEEKEILYTCKALNKLITA